MKRSENESRRVILIEVDDNGKPIQAANGFRFDDRFAVTTPWIDAADMVAGEICALSLVEMMWLSHGRRGAADRQMAREAARKKAEIAYNMRAEFYGHGATSHNINKAVA